jgi:hypothetical protein
MDADDHYRRGAAILRVLSEFPTTAISIAASMPGENAAGRREQGGKAY